MLKAIKDQYTFRVVRKIADGGMGSVYEAIQDGTKGVPENGGAQDAAHGPQQE